MAQPSLPTDQATSVDAQTRVDSAHAPETPVSAGLPSEELLEAIAGKDTEQAALQSRRQALELAGLLREKQRLLDQRESELNARTAQLENEIRSNRLKQQQSSRVAPDPRESEPRRPTLAEALKATPQEEPLVADTESPDRTEWNAGGTTAEIDAAPAVRDALRERPGVEEESIGEIRQQQAKLELRRQQLEHLQEQITEMHREALELRLATEELWAEWMPEATEESAERLAELRNRLAEHYRLANESLAQRTDELHRMRQELNEQQQRLRCQRRELQLWVDRRYDEIEARTSRVIRRERELDRLEAEFERQSMQWQRQREAYRQEIEQLTRSS